MQIKYGKQVAVIIGLILMLVIAGCSSNNANGNSNNSNGGDKEIELTLVNWESEVASTNVIAKVLEDIGYDVEITPVDMSVMWNSIVSGEADAMVAAWLPGDMKEQYEEYGDDVVDLGPNLEEAKIGLAVPTYMDIDSIEDLDDQVDKTITGIDPGAGIVTAAEEAIETYDNLDGWEVQVSSDGAMTAALGQAYEKEEPIIVTAWSPHWKFAVYDLKYLEDPENSFGDEQHISTMVREGLEEDKPDAYKVLDAFYWSVEDMESVMLDISDGVDPAEAAEKWVEENEDKVSEWTKDI